MMTAAVNSQNSNKLLTCSALNTFAHHVFIILQNFRGFVNASNHLMLCLYSVFVSGVCVSISDWVCRLGFCLQWNFLIHTSRGPQRGAFHD